MRGNGVALAFAEAGRLTLLLVKRFLSMADDNASERAVALAIAHTHHRGSGRQRCRWSVKAAVAKA
jgi:hypothetical protein